MASLLRLHVRSIVVAVCGATLLVGVACKPSNTALKGQTNARMVFYGRAVDEDGKPLGEVTFEFLVESFPANWSYERRGEPLEKTKLHASSGSDGRFQI